MKFFETNLAKKDYWSTDKTHINNEINKLNKDKNFKHSIKEKNIKNENIGICYMNITNPYKIITHKDKTMCSLTEYKERQYGTCKSCGFFISYKNADSIVAKKIKSTQKCDDCKTSKKILPKFKGYAKSVKTFYISVIDYETGLVKCVKNKTTFYLPISKIDLLESSGLKDKKKKEIYKGDILLLHKIKYVVFIKDNKFFLTGGNKHKELTNILALQSEVIGNTYESIDPLQDNKTSPKLLNKG